jgi:fibronectin type 3 domain-containing protein
MTQSSSIFPNIPCRLQAVLILALAFVVFFPGPAQATDRKKSLPPVINVKVSPKARLTIFHTVAVLPVLTEERAIDNKRSLALYRGVAGLNKYHLVPLESAEAWLNRKGTKGKNIALAELARLAGTELKASAVITAEVHPHRQLGELLVSSDSTPVTSWDITMHDTRNGQAVWHISLSWQDNEKKSGQTEPLPRILQEGFSRLQSKMVQQGDIFSTQLPKPEILSTQGDIRSVRIVLQPDPPHVFSQYRLLRADTMEGVFRPVAGPVKNSAPLILSDRGLKDATTYFYTVIGINKQGFANVPPFPVRITTTGAPAPVQKLHASGGGLRHIQLFWDPSQDPTVKEYVIYRGKTPAGPFRKIGIVSGREQQTYVDKGQPSGYSRYGVLEDNSTYFYTIRTRNVVGVESKDSPVVSATTRGKPQPPTDLRAFDRLPKKVPLSWTAPPDPEVVGYAVFRSLQAEGAFKQIDFVSGRQSQQYVDDGNWDHPLKNNTTYWYRLRSVNVVDAQSADSVTVHATTKAAPVAVQGLSAQSGLFRQVVLRWQPNPEPDIRGYEIYRGTIVDDVHTKIGRTGPRITRYTDSGLSDGRTYWYQVRAIDRDGLIGKRSAVIQATTKHPPKRPVDLRATTVPNGILLTWRISPGQDVNYFEISSGSFLSGILGRTKKPSFLFRGDEKPGTELRFVVRAVDSDGLKSEYSEPLVFIVPEE